MQRSAVIGLVLLASVLSVLYAQPRIWTSTNCLPIITIHEDTNTGGGLAWCGPRNSAPVLRCPAFDYRNNRFVAKDSGSNVLVLDYIRSTGGEVHARQGTTNRIFFLAP